MIKKICVLFLMMIGNVLIGEENSAKKITNNNFFPNIPLDRVYVEKISISNNMNIAGTPIPSGHLNRGPIEPVNLSIESKPKQSFPDAFKKDPNKCHEFYAKIKDIMPNIYVASSSDKMWEGKMSIDIYYNWIKDILDDFRIDYPKTFDRLLGQKDFAIIFNTVEQCKKYADKYPGCLNCNGLGGTGPYGIDMFVIEDRAQSEEVKKQVIRLFLHELGHFHKRFFTMQGRDQLIELALNAIKKNQELWPAKCGQLKELSSLEYFSELFTIWFGFGISYEECLGTAEDADSARENLKKYDKISYGLMTTLFNQSEKVE